MTLSKKHFIRVAEIIKKRMDFLRDKPDSVVGGMRAELIGLAGDFADYFVEENPLFNRQKFLEACGVKE